MLPNTTMFSSDLRGVFRLLLGILSPSTVAQRSPRALLRYCEFGDEKTEMLAPTLCEARQTGMPAFLARVTARCGWPAE